jgi:bifunctional non-homologous end joining protein LigD
MPPTTSPRLDGHIIKLSHTDKVLFPDDGITKGHLIDYYQRIAPTMLPHLKNRPLTLRRFPNGITRPGFYQREISEYFPKWINRVTVPDKQGGTTTSVICNNAATLVYLANQACITPHAWLSRRNKVNYPDRLIFDLDPTKDDFDPVRKIALILRDTLHELELVPFVQTTGSRGLHVVVALDQHDTFDAVRTFAKHVATHIVQNNPALATIEQRIQKRQNKVFIDVLRNSYAQSAVAPYAVRARPGAPVATPLEWSELTDPKVHSQRFTIQNILKRLEKQPDPWQKIDQTARSLRSAQKQLK